MSKTFDSLKYVVETQTCGSLSFLVLSVLLSVKSTNSEVSY